MDKKVKLVLVSLSAFLCFNVFVRNVARAQELRPLSVEDALEEHSFGQLMPIVGFSADGKWLAYVIKENQRSKSVDFETRVRTGVPTWVVGTDICTLNIETGETKNLTGGTGNNWLPTWSPDARYLAFFSDRDASGQARLWIWDAAKNVLTRVSQMDLRGDEIEWTPDSKRILVTVRPEGPSLEKKADKASTIEISRPITSTFILYHASAVSQSVHETPKSDPWSLDLDLRDLALVDVASGKVSLIVRGQRVAKYLLSPDGLRVAYTNPKSFEKPGSQQILFNLLVITLPTMEERVIASKVRLDYDGASFSWSPDGRQLSFHTGGMEETSYDCFVVGVQEGIPRNVTMLPPPTQKPRYKSTVPLWDTKGEHIYFIRDGGLWRSTLSESSGIEVGRVSDRRIKLIVPKSGNLLWTIDGDKSTIVLTQDDAGKQDGFYKIDLTTGESNKLLEKGQCYTCTNTDEQVTITKDGRHVAYFAEDGQHDADLWINDPSFRNPHRLTHLNPQFDKYIFGRAQLINWLSDDGEHLEGALLLPADYQEGKRYPLIVYVYGGRLLSSVFDHFGLAGTGPFNMQLLATRGFAVLFPDAPQHLGTPMLDLAKTVLPGVNKVIEMGIADSSRLGVMGHSYGGYSTLALIVQSKRFKAAIETDGSGDLVGQFGAMDKDGTAFGTSIEEQGQGLMGATPWQFRNRYIENSPIFYLDRVETPLLIVHGSEDENVPPFLADEVFVGLRRLGKEVEYVKYQGEGHSPLYWSYANQVDYCNRVLSWFDTLFHAGKR